MADEFGMDDEFDLDEFDLLEGIDLDPGMAALDEELIMELAASGIVAEEDEEHYQDPGEAGYDAEKEDELRGLIELCAFYDEAGPRSDPAGEYLCGTCRLRQGTDKCLWVSGDISFTAGSCDIYMHGDALSETLELKEKYSQDKAGYVERPETKAFGCQNCTYGKTAQEPDRDGRTLWCEEWGAHVEPLACCARHKGPDLVEAPGESGDESTS